MGRRADHNLLASSPCAPASGPVKAIQTDTSVIKIDAAEVCRRQPIILNKSARASALFAELAGGKTAECAAICCCCPCGLIDLVILAVVRLPASICQRALRKRILLRRSKKKAKLLGSNSGLNSESSAVSGSGTGSGGFSSRVGSASDDEFAEFAGWRSTVVMVVADSWPGRSPSAEVIKHEKELWSKFYSSGFWRSPSQKEDL